MMKILEISTVGNSMTSMAYCLNSTNLTQIEDSYYAIEFDQDKILEDLLAKEVMIEYKGDTVTVDDIFASFK